MSKPKREIESEDYFKDIHFLYEIINLLKNVDEIKFFLKDILTPAELRMLKRRWHIAVLLSEGFDIREVAYRSKTSTQTVSKIKQVIEEGRGGIEIAISRMKRKQEKERKEFIKSKRGIRGSKYVGDLFG